MPVWLLPLLGGVKGVAGAALKALSNPVVLCAVVAGLAVLWGLHEHRRADGLAAALTAEQAAFRQERDAFLAEQAHSARLEAARASEHAEAVHDASDAQRACTARVDAARKSAAAITAILNEPPHANPDPAEPELIPDSVWDAASGR